MKMPSSMHKVLKAIERYRAKMVTHETWPPLAFILITGAVLAGILATAILIVAAVTVLVEITYHATLTMIAAVLLGCAVAGTLSYLTWLRDTTK